jgi:hypothetical protein
MHEMADDTTAGGHAFWWRLLDNLFRRWGLFLIPVVAMGALGVVQAGNTVAQYQTAATLSVAANPLLPEQPVSGAEVGRRESVAGATSRTINERLGTDAFLSEVARQAGLGDAIDSGFLGLPAIRGRVWAGSSGQSLVRVNATWADPQTAHRLVLATIDEYRRFVADTVTTAAASAEEFWSEQLVQLQTDRDATEAELDEYVAGLPTLEGGSDYPATVELELNRLYNQIDSLQIEIGDVQRQVDTAVLTRTQQSASAGQSLSVIDPPVVPNAPESTLVRQAMTIVAFVLMGGVIAIAALFVTTLLDRTISSPVELMALPSVANVVTVPGPGRRRKPEPSPRQEEFTEAMS